LYSELNN